MNYYKICEQKMTTIVATKDLFHEDGTKSFTKSCEYTVKNAYNQLDLIESYATNDQGEKHKIGLWYKHFKIVG